MLKRILLIVIVMFWTAGLTSAEPMPRIEADQPVFDFGEVLQGLAVEHTFVFRNTGDAVLLVDRVKSTCGCTGVLLSNKNIPPGSEGTVKATFNSSRFQGEVHKNILLYSNDPSGEPLTFTVKGLVILPLKAEPANLFFGEVPIGQSKTISTILTNHSGAQLILTNLRTSNTAFRAEVDEQLLERGASTELRVTALPEAKTVNLVGEVLIRLDLPRLGEFRVPVSGSVVPAPPVK